MNVKIQVSYAELEAVAVAAEQQDESEPAGAHLVEILEPTNVRQLHTDDIMNYQYYFYASKRNIIPMLGVCLKFAVDQLEYRESK